MSPDTQAGREKKNATTMSENSTCLENCTSLYLTSADYRPTLETTRWLAGCWCAAKQRARESLRFAYQESALAAGVSWSVRTAGPLGSVVRSWTVVFLFCASPAEHCTLLESPNFRIKRHLHSPNLQHIRRQRAGCGCAGNSALSSRFDLRIRRQRPHAQLRY